jgi:CelD/BcsL family acetyltransferase involved in cellulose biosynthesis
LIVAELDGRAAGLLPLVCDERHGRPVLRFAGAPFNDLGDAMVLPGHEPEAADAFIEALVDAASEGCEVRLDDLDPAGALAGADARLRRLRWEPGSAAPVIDLRDPTAGLSPRRLQRLDRSLGQLRAKHFLEFRCQGGSSAVEILPHFMRQRDTRLRALGRSLSLPPAGLLEAAVRVLAPGGHCVFAEMLIDGQAVARDLYLLDGKVAMLWLRALDMAWLKHSCGHALLLVTAERLKAEGYEGLDLGRGDEPYKFSFGARERQLLNARLPANDIE